MIKILRAKHEREYVIRLEFSDGSSGNLDMTEWLARETPLTEGLRDTEQFGRFFIDLGALCWPNGLELSPAALHRRMRASGALLNHSSVT